MGSDDWSHISARLVTSQVDCLHSILSQNSVFVQQTALEEKDSIFFWNKEFVVIVIVVLVPKICATLLQPQEL